MTGTAVSVQRESDFHAIIIVNKLSARHYRFPTHLENLENSWNFMLDLEFLV